MHEFARAYLNFRDDSEINWVMIRAVLASVVDVAIVPLQDVLGLGSEARMNLPARSAETGNGVIAGSLERRVEWKLLSWVTLYDR